ncbi:unnamed protein product [Schistosoma mattheei]|uniref:Uncharacterized protein n=1 Tax=Schistosoma mattheei TaxID=31246 RepID=A0A183PDR2_9TREM|nr:unnamed protein product [Schistosoma mattheei]
MVVGDSRQETLDPGFVLLGTQWSEEGGGGGGESLYLPSSILLVISLFTTSNDQEFNPVITLYGTLKGSK